jgi:hypothetical protein
MNDMMDLADTGDQAQAPFDPISGAQHMSTEGPKAVYGMTIYSVFDQLSAQWIHNKLERKEKLYEWKVEFKDEVTGRLAQKYLKEKFKEYEDVCIEKEDETYKILHEKFAFDCGLGLAIVLSTEETRDVFQEFYKKFNHDDHTHYVTWYFKNDAGQTETTKMKIKGIKHKIDDCFYPYLKKGVDQFIYDYMDSDAPVLILMGPPGTGKSTFLRHIINKIDQLNFRDDVCVTYNPDIIYQDVFYKNFLNNHSMCIIEDADTLLEKREMGNNGMTRILNIGDGIFDIANKKMIITTNIIDVAKIDEALIRPGRCFDIVKFRDLSLNESNKIRKHLHLPELNEKKTYTLAEVFDNNRPTEKPVKIGF